MVKAPVLAGFDHAADGLEEGRTEFARLNKTIVGQLQCARGPLWHGPFTWSSVPKSVPDDTRWGSASPSVSVVDSSTKTRGCTFGSRRHCRLLPTSFSSGVAEGAL
jgi:hypothetical protein